VSILPWLHIYMVVVHELYAQRNESQNLWPSGCARLNATRPDFSAIGHLDVID
jgi:hypothetical protein